jgi:hypothetical protein
MKFEELCKNIKPLHELIVSLQKLDCGCKKLGLGISRAVSKSSFDSESKDKVFASNLT